MQLFYTFKYCSGGLQPPPQTGPDSFVFAHVLGQKASTSGVVPSGSAPPTGNTGFAAALVFETSQEMVKIHTILDMFDVCLPFLVC